MPKLRVAIIQNNAIADHKENCKKIEHAIDKAILQKAKFVLLPETFSYRAQTETDARVHAETLEGPTLTALRKKAANASISILAGSIAETNQDETGKVFNTSVLINAEGDFEAIYRKIHLFDAKVGDKVISESSIYSMGNKAVTGMVNGHKLGLSICYDLRFPYLFEFYRKQGVAMVCVPSSFTAPTGKAHWHALLRARAIENQFFVLAPDQIGYGARGVKTYGHSLIINPWGDIIAEGSEDLEEIIYADLDFDELKYVRSIMPKLIREEVLNDTTKSA